MPWKSIVKTNLGMSHLKVTNSIHQFMLSFFACVSVSEIQIFAYLFVESKYSILTFWKYSMSFHEVTYLIINGTGYIIQNYFNFLMTKYTLIAIKSCGCCFFTGNLFQKLLKKKCR